MIVPFEGLGYRHFDTATRYGNEHLLGNALSKWISNEKHRREELFIVTKVSLIYKSQIQLFLKN